MNKACVRRQIL